jgi:uncharacterized membrane protein
MKALAQFSTLISKKYLFLMVVAAVALRLFCFYSYIRYEERYKQADSVDYHIAALCIASGLGMHRPDTHTPLFWRTPGYPAYLTPFYTYFGTTGTTFSGASRAQQASIVTQIILNGCIPIILFFLALYLTHSLAIAYIMGWLAVFHIGLVLASTYLLSEGLALIFFYFFLYYFYRSFSGIYQEYHVARWKKDLVVAAILLAIYTWFRPMGQFVALTSALILAVCAQNRKRYKWKKITLFLFVFFLSLSPWYIRNYQLTGSWFFCPMSGAYLNAFCAPRIKSTIENKDLIESWKELGVQAELKHREIAPAYTKLGLTWPKEFSCGIIAWPIIMAHPLPALSDWLRESAKTAFDLYASQLTAFVKGCFFYDPIIEYLSDKLSECLYATPMHWSMRALVYLELIYMLILWAGLFAGFWSFFVVPLYKRMKVPSFIQNRWGLWFKVLPMIASIILMTGGFGYARLRLPIEPLLIILSLTFWQRVWTKKDE